MIVERESFLGEHIEELFYENGLNNISTYKLCYIWLQYKMIVERE